MVEKRSKYDTDPLDPDFVRQTEEVRDAGTREVTAHRRNSDSSNSSSSAGIPSEPAETERSQQAEAPTRRYDQPQPSVQSSVPSNFVPFNSSHQQPHQRITPLAASTTTTTTVSPPSDARVVSGIGLPENVARVLPYAPFYIGAVIGVVELLLVPRSEARTRFHAAQGLALHLVVLVAGLLFRVADFLVSNTLGDFSSAALQGIWSLSKLAALVLLVFSMVRVWRESIYRLAPLADATKWLDDHIEPRK